MIVDEIVGRFVSASNVTLLGRSSGALVVYKPLSGNRPLWDFDVETLAIREVLTYEISEAMGLGAVPPTVLGDGPLGPGAIQVFVEEDEAADPIDLVQNAHDSLWPLAVLDVIVNNADRKAGHVLIDTAAHIWGIDHGLTFHPEDKLRTVLWGLSGRPLPEDMVAAVDALATALDGGLAATTSQSLGAEEADAL
ncbi:phosphatidylinositol kinase, partial [bacterium]|nr:phosphatidylinositol kinase [bacterium]